MVKYYGTKVVKHPQGWYYKVAFLSPKKTLGYSKMLSAWKYVNRKKTYMKIK